jgi:predicted amidohydrolase YtcJ
MERRFPTRNDLDDVYEELISLEDSIQSYTRGSGIAGFAGESTRIIATDSFADLTLLSNFDFRHPST